MSTSSTIWASCAPSWTPASSHEMVSVGHCFLFFVPPFLPRALLDFALPQPRSVGLLVTLANTLSVVRTGSCSFFLSFFRGSQRCSCRRRRQVPVPAAGLAWSARSWPVPCLRLRWSSPRRSSFESTCVHAALRFWVKARACVAAYHHEQSHSGIMVVSQWYCSEVLSSQHPLYFIHFFMLKYKT